MVPQPPSCLYQKYTSLFNLSINLGSSNSNTSKALLFLSLQTAQKIGSGNRSELLRINQDSLCLNVEFCLCKWILWTTLQWVIKYPTVLTFLFQMNEPDVSNGKKKSDLRSLFKICCVRTHDMMDQFLIQSCQCPIVL